MDRWWTDQTKVEEFSKRWSADDDPAMLVGSALLVLHAVGNKHLQHEAVDANRPNSTHALRLIDDDPLIGPICKAFDDASGIPGYGANRIAQLKRAADAGTIALVSGLVADKVPMPLAISRAGSVYGVTAPEMRRLSHSMKSHDLVADKAADQALMKWASFISDVESDRIAKAEQDTFQVKGKTRTAYRDEETGEFVSAGEAQEKELSPAEAKRQRLEAKRAQYMQQAAQRKAKAAQQKAGVQRQEAPVTATLPKEETKAEAAMVEEEKPAKQEEWRKWHNMRRAAAARQERFAAEEAAEADVRRSVRRGAVAEAEARLKNIESRMVPWEVAATEQKTVGAQKTAHKGRQKTKVETGTKTEPGVTHAVAYDKNNPARTAEMYNDSSGGAWIMPKAWKSFLPNKEEMYPSMPRELLSEVISLYSGQHVVPQGKTELADMPSDAVKKALLTRQWYQITQRDQTNVPGGFGFLIDQRSALDESDQDLINQFTTAAIETLDGHASDNGMDVGDSRIFPAIDRGQDIGEYVDLVLRESNLIGDTGSPLLLSPSMDSTDMLKLMLDRGGFAAEQAAPLTRAFQIRRLTDEPGRMQPIESIRMVYEDAFMPYQVVDADGNVLSSSLDSNSGFESTDNKDSMRDALFRAMREAIAQDPMSDIHIELLPMQSATGNNPKNNVVIVPDGVRALSRAGKTGGIAVHQNPLALSIPGMERMKLSGMEHAQKHLGLVGDPIKDSAAYLFGSKEA